MLSDLNKVNWNNLSHAYGEAADVPALLLGLASEAPDTRQKALILLYRNIWHEGVVFEATAYAVPFLRQLLEHPEVQDKEKILILLAHLATGNAYLDVFPSDETAETLSETTYKARLAMERSWVQATNDAVQKGTPTYVRLLEDRDPIVRMCAAYLLACFQTINRKIVPVLLQIIENEVQQQAKASMMLALGVLAKNRPAYIECLHRFRGPAHPLLVRVAATMAIARNQRTAAPDDALELLVDALSAPGAELHTAYQMLPWADGGLTADVSMVICYFGRERAAYTLPDLLRAFQFADEYDALLIAHALLFIAFGSKKQAWDVAHLTAAQRTVLAAIKEHDPLWLLNLDVSELLRDLGLPDWPEELAAFLAG